MFDLEVGGTLILERGITIEIHCANANDVAKVTVIKGVSNLTTEKYPGLNIITEGNVIRIVVTGNTTLVGDVE
jgi:ribosomal protein S8E